MGKVKIGGVYAIQWLDHLSVREGEGAWMKLEDAVEAERTVCESYGMVVGEDPLYFTMVGTNCDIDHPSKGVVGDVNKILKSTIVKVKKLT